MRPSLRPNPSELVNETVPASRSRSPIGATGVTTTPPAGGHTSQPGGEIPAENRIVGV